MDMMQPKPSHVIFLEWPLGRSSGGPAGGLWHLRHGLEAASLIDKVKFVVPSPEAPRRQRPSLAKHIDKIRQFSEPLWRLLKTYGPTIVAREYREYTGTPIENYFASPEWEAVLTDKNYVSFHCHTTFDALRVHNSLRRLGRRGEVTLYLTSHCPEMPALEKRDIMVNNGLMSGKAPQVLEALTKIDAAAFHAADILIFPCADALEPYYETWPGFQDVVAAKNIKYLFTGIDSPPREQPLPLPLEAANRLKLSYIGRHNKVKGYDFLLKTVPSLLEEFNASMLVAGKQGPLFGPTHPHWHEFGWVPAAQELIAQSDLFLLANARTYFDVVALEVMALGIPILASRTGGNKALAPLSPGVILFDNSPESFAAALRDFAKKPAAERQAAGQANRAAYEQFFTARKFAEDYVRLVAQK